MRRLVLLAITALVAFGLLAPAARADSNGVGTFIGEGDWGRHFVDQFSFNGALMNCRKETFKSVVARGQGLFLPTFVQPGRNAVWSLHTTITFVDAQGGPLLRNGTLDICGWLQHIGKRAHGTAVGPACSLSKGHNGRGQINFFTGRGLNLFDLGWKAEAGGTVPLLGKYQVWDGTKGPGKQKQDKWGNVLGQLQVQGGIACTQQENCMHQKTAGPNTLGCGAQNFLILGTVQFIQPGDTSGDGRANNKDDVIRPKTVPPACKSTANSSCAWDDNKHGSDFGLKPPGPAFKTD